MMIKEDNISNDKRIYVSIHEKRLIFVNIDRESLSIPVIHK